MTAFTQPSWLGLLVIFALPSLVSMIAPFRRRFCLARKVFWGVSNTFFISAFFTPCFVFRLQASAFNRTVFVFPPLVLSVFRFVLFMVVTLSWTFLSNDFFFLLAWYFPLEIFLPLFMVKFAKVWF